jgi:hypothetical protein
MSFVRRFILDIQSGFRWLWRRDLAVDRPETQTHLDKAKENEQQHLFASVGMALTAWSRMEEMLVAFVALLLQTSAEKAGVIMYSTINFNTWLSLIHDLFDLDETLAKFRSRFDKISEKIRRIKDRRDQLAHHSIRLTGDPFIRPSKYDVRSKSKKQQPLGPNEVRDFMLIVSGIADDLAELFDAMSAELVASREKLLEPEIDPHPPADSR